MSGPGPAEAAAGWTTPCMYPYPYMTAPLAAPPALYPPVPEPTAPPPSAAAAAAAPLLPLGHYVKVDGQWSPMRPKQIEAFEDARRKILVGGTTTGKSSDGTTYSVTHNTSQHAPYPFQIMLGGGKICYVLVIE